MSAVRQVFCEAGTEQRGAWPPRAVLDEVQRVPCLDESRPETRIADLPAQGILPP